MPPTENSENAPLPPDNLTSPLISRSHAGESAVVDKIYKFDSKADKNAVRFVYLYFLGREPENEAAVELGASLGRSIEQLIVDIKNSHEYKNNSRAQDFFKFLVMEYKNNYADSEIKCKEISESTMMIQTADPYRYSEMLNITSRYNKIYAKNHNMNYQSFLGIKRGIYPHHATYNRVFMLQELVNLNYRGWVMYLDADCLVRDPDFSFPKMFQDLRLDGKFMLLHNVYAFDDQKFRWFDVNAGAFAIDLSSNMARFLISLWSKFYSIFYSDHDFEQALQWKDLTNDQDCLHMILQILDKEFGIKNSVHLEQFQLNKIQQNLRSSIDSTPSEEDIKSRCEHLGHAGNSIYGT